MNSDKDIQLSNKSCSVDASNRIYLAVAQRQSEYMMYVVYALLCQREQNSNSYEMNARSHIVTFADADGANLYQETIKQAMRYQKKMQPRLYDVLQKWNDKIIKDFHQNTK